MQEPVFVINRIEIQEQTLTGEVRIDSDHRLFQGHFPGAPVMPGVMELAMVKAVLQKHLDRKLKMKTLRTSKFLEVLNPLQTPVIQVEVKFRDAEMIEVTAAGSFEGVTFFKANATYF